MNWKTNFLILTLTLVMLTLCEARGAGRRGGGSGGGGSFGSLFGKWRKSKNQLSSGAVSSRRIASSVPPSPPQRDNFLKPNNYYNNNYNSTLSPKVGSYYHDTGILPANKIDSVNDYFKTRSIMTGIVQPDYRHNFLRDDAFLNDMLTILRSIFQQAVSSTEEPLTTATFSTTENLNTESTGLPQFSTTETSMQAPYGTICMPMSVHENNEEGEQVQVEKIICYPAPAPPASEIDLESKQIEISGDIIEP